jgi:hypothetical protein
MFKVFLNNLKREVNNIYIDLEDIVIENKYSILSYTLAFLLGLIVSLTYGRIFG